MAVARGLSGGTAIHAAVWRLAGHPSATPSIRPAGRRPATTRRVEYTAAWTCRIWRLRLLRREGWMRHVASRPCISSPLKDGTAGAQIVLDQGGWTDPGLFRNGLTSLYQLSLIRSYSDWHWLALASVRKPLSTKFENACTLLPYIQHATL